MTTMAEPPTTLPTDEADLDPRDAELIARAEAIEEEALAADTGSGEPSHAALEPASDKAETSADTEATDVNAGAPPPTAPTSTAAPAPVALRKAVKIVLRLAQANEQGQRAAHVFVRVDGADPVCAVRVPPCADALGRALQGVEAAVARALADPPKAPAATRAAPAPAKAAKPASQPADAPRICVVCKGSYAKGRYKAHAQEPGHKTAELAAAARSTPAPARITPPTSAPSGAPALTETPASTPPPPASESAPAEGPSAAEPAPTAPATPPKPSKGQTPANADARPVQVSLF